MSEHDSIKPYHAREAAPGQEAADVVAEVLAHAQARDAAANQRMKPKGPPKWMLPLTVNMGVLALYFLIAQPDFLVVNPIEDRRPMAAQIQQTKNAMYVNGIARIDAYQAANGRLPATLAEANAGDLAQQGVQYSVQDSAYILIMTVGGETIVFDSATQTAEEFVGDLGRMIGG
jgi:hypothetical protein